MGIFAGKKYNTATGELEKTIEQYQKIADKKDITLPQSPKEQPKKGLLAKTASVLSSFETAPAVEAALKGENPFEAYKSSIKKGLSAKEDITTKKSYSDVLETAGWKSVPGTGSLRESATWKNFGKEIVGLAGDIFLDPTTYLTFGTSKATQLGTKTGTKTLSKTGEKILATTAKEQSPVIAETLLKKGIRKTEQELTEAGIKRAGRNIAKSTDKTLFDQGGIKFFGKTLVGGDTLKKPFTKIGSLMSKTESGANIINGMNKIKDGIGKSFYRDYGLPEKYVGAKQEYLDLYKSDADDVVTTLTGAFKGTSKADREAISSAIEKTDYRGLSESQRYLAEKSRKIFDDIAKQEGDRGLLNDTLDDYVTHIYKDREKAKQLLDFMKTGVRGGKTRFAKARVIPTIEEAEKLGLKPEKDIANILAARLMASKKAIREQDLLRKTAGKFGVSRKSIKYADVLDKDLVEYTNKEFKGLLIPRRIAEDISKIGKKAISNEEINKFLRGYDAIQNFFKGSVTSIFPAFHGRNYLSNVAQNILDIGVKALDPISNMRAINILRKGSKGTLTTKLGQKYSYHDLRTIMKKEGVLGSPGVRDVAETVEQKLSKGLNKIKQATPFNVGRAVGTAIEDHARSLNFLSNLEAGLPIKQAAKRTKEFLFDYENLSDFEKTIMRRAIPFYTWTRKNIELQAKTLFKRPGVIGAELKAQRLSPTQETERERQALPEYISEGLAIKLNNKNGLVNYLTGFGMPIENFFQNLPQGITLDEIVDYLNKIASQGAFIPKFIAELSTGHEFFRNKPIKEIYNGAEYKDMPGFVQDFLQLKEKKVDYINKKTGKRVKYTEYVANPYRLHMVRSLPTSRLVSTGGIATSEDLSPTQRLVRLITGVKIYPIDVQRMEEKELKNYLREIEDTLVNYGELNKFENTYVPKK